MTSDTTENNLRLHKGKTSVCPGILKCVAVFFRIFILSLPLLTYNVELSLHKHIQVQETPFFSHSYSNWWWTASSSRRLSLKRNLWYAWNIRQGMPRSGCAMWRKQNYTRTSHKVVVIHQAK